VEFSDHGATHRLKHNTRNRPLPNLSTSKSPCVSTFQRNKPLPRMYGPLSLYGELSHSRWHGLHLRFSKCVSLLLSKVSLHYVMCLDDATWLARPWLLHILYLATVEHTCCSSDHARTPWPCRPDCHSATSRRIGCCKSESA
jgi:hypothetical protein